MARKYEVTNLSRGPRGFHTIDRGEVVIPRHASEVITVSGNTEEMLLAMGRKGEVEVSDLGAVDALDHDGDGKKGGAAPALKPAVETVTLGADTKGVQEALAEAKKAVETETARADKAEAELAALKEPKRYTVGPLLAALLDDAGIENFADLQPVLEAIEEALQPVEGVSDASSGGTDGADGPAAETVENAGPAEYAPSMDFAKLNDDQLRAFLKAAEVTVHPQTKTPKLVEKALAADRAQWDEAQKALAAGGAPAQPENDEAV